MLILSKRQSNIAFTVLNYPMSYRGAYWTILYLWSVWLIMKQTDFDLACWDSECPALYGFVLSNSHLFRYARASLLSWSKHLWLDCLEQFFKR